MSKHFLTETSSYCLQELLLDLTWEPAPLQALIWFDQRQLRDQFLRKAGVLVPSRVSKITLIGVWTPKAFPPNVSHMAYTDVSTLTSFLNDVQDTPKEPYLAVVGSDFIHGWRFPAGIPRPSLWSVAQRRNLEYEKRLEQFLARVQRGDNAGT